MAELRATRRARHQGRPAGDDAPLLSAETVASIVHVMSSLYRAAMKEHPPVVLSNPFAELDLPAIEPRPVDFYEPDEAEQLFNAVEQLSGPAVAEPVRRAWHRVGTAPRRAGRPTRARSGGRPARRSLTS